MPRGEGTIGFVRVRPLNFRYPRDYTFERYLRASIVSGLGVLRHRRLWRFSATTERGEDLLVGRIGWDRPDGTTELWDERQQTFVRSSVPEGHSTPFVLDVRDGRVAFQARGSIIKLDTFQWSFQALLRAGSPETRPRVRWEVRKELNTETLDQFLSRAARVDEMTFTLEPPNPNYHGRSQVKQLVEETNTAMTRVVLQASKEELEGINIDATFVKQARSHVDQDYGSARVTAEFAVTDAEPVKDKWKSETEGTPRTESAPVNPTTGDISFDLLAEALESEAVGQSSVEDEDNEDE